MAKCGSFVSSFRAPAPFLEATQRALHATGPRLQDVRIDHRRRMLSVQPPWRIDLAKSPRHVLLVDRQDPR